jgi:hypothetical protein
MIWRSQRTRAIERTTNTVGCSNLYLESHIATPIGDCMVRFDLHIVVNMMKFGLRDIHYSQAFVEEKIQFANCNCLARVLNLNILNV